MSEPKGIEFLTYSLAGAAVIVAASFARREKDKYTSFCMALVLPIVTVAIAIPFWLTEVLHPQTADALLYRMDLVIGLDPFRVWRKVQHLPWLYADLSFVYQSIPLFVALAYAFEKPRFLFRALVAGSILAFIFYNVFPAVGPAHVQNPLGMPRNCFPSMHLGWALLVAWNVRGRAMRIAAWIFTALTAFATIGLGEHYFIDLIAAVPFCYAVQRIVSTQFAGVSKSQNESSGPLPVTGD
jgi:hypothetical protein